MSAPPGLGDDGRPQRLRVFEEKVALLPARMYQDRDPIGWKNMTRNYWVGRNKGMKNFLEWIEGKLAASPRDPNEQITEDEIDAVCKSCALMTNMNLTDASEQMWAYLDINLQGSVREIFSNVGMLNGAEAWRRVVEPIDKNSDAKQNRLRLRT